MLDVHVLVMDYTDPEILAKCKASIAEAVERAGYPVRVHYIPGIYGHLGAARERGYRLGDYRYVTHVDDDDYIAPDAFAKLLPLMEQGVDAITTGETWVVDGVEVAPKPDSRHHLAVYQRDLLFKVPFRAFRYYPDQFLMAQIPAVHISECLYYLRINENSGSRRCRLENEEDARQEQVMLRKPELVAAEMLTQSQIRELYDELIDGPTPPVWS